MTGSILAGGSIRILWDEDDSAEVTITGGNAVFTVGGVAATFPYTLTSSTTFSTTQSGVYTVSVQHYGYEIAGTPDGTRQVTLRFGEEEIFAPTPDSRATGTGLGAMVRDIVSTDVPDSGTDIGGALSTTFERKTVIDVTSGPYNAAGDGTTDDTAAIRAAFDDAALVTEGATVYFPPGTYRVTNTLHPTANGGAGIWTANKAVFLVGDKTTLRGAGRGKTIISMEFANLTSSATADSRLVFAVGDDFTAEGIHFRGNYNPGTWAFFPTNNDNGCIGPSKATTYRQAVRHCKFSNLPGFYVGTMVTHGAVFTDNIVDHCANGYNVNGSSTLVHGNEFYYSEGVEAAGAIASPSTSPNGRIQVTNNSFFECSIAASLGGNTGTTTDHDSFGYVFDANTVHNLAVVSNAQVVIANNARSFVVAGNTFRGEFKYGVNVTQGGNTNAATTPRDGLVTGNMFDQSLDGAVTVGYAVGWSNYDGRVVVSNNTMLMGPNQTAMISAGLTPAETTVAGNFIYARYALTQTSTTTGKTLWSSTNVFVPSDASPRYSITTGAALTESVYTPAAHRVSLMGQTEYPEFVSRLRGVGTETNDAIAVHKRYYSGKYEWGPNTGAAVDTSLERTAVGVLSVGAANALRTGRAVTGSRPSASTMGAGAMFYDTTLSKPIWSDGTVWRDAAGTAV